MSESILSVLPGLRDENDNVTYTFTTGFTSSVDGTITDMRWNFPLTLPTGTCTVGLFRRTTDLVGTLLASKSFDPSTITLDANRWGIIPLDAPVNITANTDYLAAIYTPNHYVATSKGLQNGPISNGQHLTAWQDDVGNVRRNGRFRSPSTGLQYPNTQFNGGLYFIDVVFRTNVSNGTHTIAEAIEFEGAHPLNRIKSLSVSESHEKETPNEILRTKSLPIRSTASGEVANSVTVIQSGHFVYIENILEYESALRVGQPLVPDVHVTPVVGSTDVTISAHNSPDVTVVISTQTLEISIGN